MKKRLYPIGVLLAVLMLSISAKAQINNVASYPFTASSTSLTYVTGGTALNILGDDRTDQNIPIGFTFLYAGVPYTSVSVCSNGWAAFGSKSSTTYSNTQSNMNSLRPVLMPLFDDLRGDRSACQAHYSTTGTAGSRVFTIEWRDWASYSSSSFKMTFQVKLYEGPSNVIEFLYKNEASSTSLNSATIGLGGHVSGDYQVLDDASASPTTNTTSFIRNISTAPATGQSYKWDSGPVCDKLTALTMGGLNSTSATVNWTHPASGVKMYEYYVDKQATINTSATTTTTASNTAMVNGLKPSTQYWFHIRRLCTSNNTSSWDHISFTTFPPCTMSKRIKVNSIDSTSINFSWASVSAAITYEYLIDNDRNDPSPSSPLISSTTNTINKTGLNSGTWYFVHARSLCAGADSSGWMLDSFYTPRPCIAPIVEVSDVSVSRGVASWLSVLTASSYEYAITQSSASPSFGNATVNQSVLLPYLKDGVKYFIHVRAQCVDSSIKSVSKWARKSFTTTPLNVNTLNNGSTGIIAYPNPTKGVLNVEVAGNLSSGAVIQLTDVMGKVLVLKEVTENKLSVNINNLPSGMYLLKYRDDSRTELIKITKQ